MPPFVPVRTSFSMLRLFDETLLTRDIAEPFERRDATNDALELRRELDEKHFDVVGIEVDTRLVGFALTSMLAEGTLGRFKQSFDHYDVVGDRTPLVDLLPLLAAKPRMFVLGRAEIAHIVTRADLGKPPVRLLLFGHLTLLEMSLLEMVRLCYPGDLLPRTLPAQRLEYAVNILTLRRAKDEDIDLADCLQLGDKRTLLMKVPFVREVFGFESKSRLEDFLKKAEGLRDKIAHAQAMENGTKWEEILPLFVKVKDFLATYQTKADDIAARCASFAVEQGASR